MLSILNSELVLPTTRRTKPGYRGFLLELSREMKTEDFKDLKFAMKDFPSGEIERLNDPRDVFSYLEYRSLLGPEKLDVLRGFLEEIDRPKLIELVDDFDDADSTYPLKPRSDGGLEKDGYSITVEGGRHFDTSEGEFVEVRSGSNYGLTLINNNNHRCEVNIQVDGYEIFPKGLLWPLKLPVTVERPPKIKEKFKFFAIRDAPNGSGINKWRKEKNGVIQVKFTPERADMKITCVAPGEKSQTISCSTEATDVDFLKMVSQAFNNAVVTVAIYSWKPMGKHGVKLTEYGLHDGSRVNVNIGGIGGVKLQVPFKREKKKVDWRAGATTLEGETDQKFTTAPGFPVDPSLAVTLNLRLVARENINPLPSTGNPTPLTRATLIPPPVPN